jgi:four helix bundle protein
MFFNMDNKEFAKSLEKRTKDFAINVLKLTSKLPNLPEAKVVRYQLAKSGTSVGANYREANRARSKADFKSKISICESESSETGFWLEIIIEMEWFTLDTVRPLLAESDELLAIFASIGKNLKKE